MKTRDSTKRSTDRRKRRSRAESSARQPQSVIQRVTPADMTLGRHRVMASLALATLLLASLIFEPIGLWFFAFVCLVPWLLLVGGARQARRVYCYSYLLGLAFFLVNMRWLHTATAMVVSWLPFRVGFGYLALSAYLAAYFPFAAIPLRHAVRRRRLPLAVALPFVWTGSEMLRAVVFSGFPWFFLSHSLHGVLPLIQVSDLVGAYGVTFTVAAVNGAVADLFFVWLAAPEKSWSCLRTGHVRFSLLFAGGLLSVVLTYGVVQLNRHTTTEGPRVAIIQGDFISTVYPQDAQAHDRASEQEKMRIYLSMIDEAAKEKPDLFLLPETPWGMVLNPGERDFRPFSRRSFNALQNRATLFDAQIVVGSGTLIRTEYDLLAKLRRYNSATVFKPDGSEPQRYDKHHLVYFGEIVPFRFGRLRFLYFWLNRMMPFSGPGGTMEYSFFPGTTFRRFPIAAPSRGGRTYHFAIPICYEDVMPYMSREFTYGGANSKQVDFLLNISNDGWFGRGIQQPQHLAICVFRAVENRVGIARAVNTGISALIDPNGRVHDRVRGTDANPWPGNCGYAVANVGVDSRFTLYSRYGDWFAWGCALVWLALFVDYWIVRARSHGEE